MFCSPEPVSEGELASAIGCESDELAEAVAEIEQAFAPGRMGLVLRKVGGSLTLASDAETELAVRRLLSKPRTPPLTQAQAECLAISAYLQPVSRPEIARIRGVNSDSPMSTLEERGLIEEKGRSQFGAILYRTTPLFEKLFGLDSPRRPARHQDLRAVGGRRAGAAREVAEGRRAAGQLGPPWAVAAQPVPPSGDPPFGQQSPAGGTACAARASLSPFLF